MTAAGIIAAVERCGGRLTFAPPDHLSADLPAAVEADLLPLLRERRAEIITLLRRSSADPCPACGARYWWRPREGAAWACGRCQPDPCAAC